MHRGRGGSLLFRLIKAASQPYPCGMADETAKPAKRAMYAFRLDPAMVARLDARARAAGLSRPEAVRLAILSWLEKTETVIARRRRIDKGEG